jgi:hypothetical protein
VQYSGEEDYESGGRGFESCRARQHLAGSTVLARTAIKKAAKAPRAGLLRLAILISPKLAVVEKGERLVALGYSSCALA